MSIVSGNVFPNTTFPDSLQSLPTFVDLDATYESVYSKYINALLEGNYLEANNYLERLNPDSLISANTLNIMSDTIGAIQALYSDTDVFTDIIENKQAEWQRVLNRFGYLGDWIQPSVFDSEASYTTNSVVLYNDKMWIRTSESSTDNPAPQTGSIYWTAYYRKNSMVTFVDVATSQRFVYLAVSDITTLNNPALDSESEIPQWLKISFSGIMGENGDGFSFHNEWTSSANYSIGDLVIYNNACYSSLQSNNSNHIPSVSTTWWKKEFQTGVAQIPIQATAPSDQVNGELWFQLIDM